MSKSLSKEQTQQQKLWSFLIKKDGFIKSKNQRFKCKDCFKKFTLNKKSKIT